MLITTKYVLFRMKVIAHMLMVHKITMNVSETVIFTRPQEKSLKQNRALYKQLHLVEVRGLKSSRESTNQCDVTGQLISNLQMKIPKHAIIQRRDAEKRKFLERGKVLIINKTKQ